MRTLVVLFVSALLAAAAPQGKAGGARRTRKAAPTAPAPAKPRQQPAAAAKFPIEALRVTGSKLYPEAAILRVAGLKAGAPLEERQLEQARDNLLVHGAFTNVGYRYDPAPSNQGYIVTFEVVELEQLFPFQFDRLDVDAAALRAHVKKSEPLFGDRISPAEPVLARYRAAIADFLRAAGKPVEVTSKVTAEGPGELVVTFAPPGGLAAVAEVHFDGNKLIAATLLQNTIHAVAIGAPFREDRFRELLDTSIRPLYEARGRLAVKFAAVKTEPVTDVKGLRVRVTIDEGPSYSFGETRVEGVPGGEIDLVKLAALKEGEVASIDAVRAAQEKIHSALKRNGHMKVTSTIGRRLDDDGKLAMFTFRVTPGPRYSFGKLTTQGLDLHGEHEVRRVWSMKAGQPFNAEYPDYFLSRVREDGLFDGLRNARPLLTVNDRDLTVDVKLIFNEPPPKPIP